MSLQAIAADLNIPEKEVLEYLKKKWTQDKYDKFLLNQHKKTSVSPSGNTPFSFIGFFRENWLAIAFFALLVFAVYANTFGNGFVSDDIAGFQKNAYLGRISIVFSGLMHFSLIAFFQFFAFHIGGLHPMSFRALNILFHLGSTVIIYLLLSLAVKKRIAFIAAALFAVHPILIESVGWISGLPYSQYGFFFLLSFLFYLFSDSNKKYLYLSIFSYVLSILSSEKAIVLFLVFALYEITFGSLRYNWKKIIPFFSFSMIVAILFVSRIGSRVSDIASSSYQQVDKGWYDPLVQIPVAIGTYLKLIFWPVKLTLYQTEMIFTRNQYILLLFVFLVYLGIVAWSWFKNKTVFFWLSFFFITLIPTLTPFKISWIVAERYVYLGTLGIIVAVAFVFDKIIEFSENGKMFGYFALIVVVSYLSVRTFIRNRDWKSEDTLWFATAKVAPSSQQIHNNLGDVYARNGDFPKAVEEFKKAIEINPNYADAYHNLANTYQQMGQSDLAMENYKKASEINPKLWQSFQNIAAIYFSQGSYDLAEENMKKALELNPQDANLQSALKYIQENRK